jgi:hypothetical protein
MAPTHGKIPCKHCRSTETILTGQSLLKAIHLCLACGKTFEIRLPTLRDGV